VPSAATAVRSGAARPIAGHKNPPPSVGTLASSHGLAGVAGGPNPRDSGGLPAIWFFLKQRSSWVWLLAMAAKVSAAGFGGCSPPRGSLQGAATIRPVQTEARRTA
jgi:hypothetical protein